MEVFGAEISPWAVAVGAGAATVLTFLALRRPAARCTSKADLRGKTVIVTGASTGIGYTTALDLAGRNARVILACRSEQRGEAAKDKIIMATGNNNVVVRILDLSRLSSVRQFAKEIQETEERLDILINNAGVFGISQSPTEDGLELNMATNHFGPFLLTSLLLDLLKRSAPSRIVNVSSGANRLTREADLDIKCLTGEKEIGTFAKYCSTKLANVLFTRELARRLEGTGVTAYALHPGTVTTELGRNVHWAVRIIIAPMMLFCKLAVFKTPEQGAQTSIYCAVEEGIEGLSGKYFAECAVAEGKKNVCPLASDPEFARKFWELSEKLTKLSQDS